jgi:hypothetical protein
MENHRRQVRRRVLKGGRILFNSKSSSIDCVVRDLSDRGALLVVENTVGIPSEFVLITSDGRTETCIARFKSPNKIGVEFRTTPEQPKSSPPPPLEQKQGDSVVLPLADDLRDAAVRLRQADNDSDTDLMNRAADILSFDSDSRRDAWAAMSLIHEAVGQIVPPGALPSEEAINAKYGPTLGGYAEAICEALAKIR